MQAAITAAGGQLPPQMPTPPTFQKVNPADSPILYLALSSPTMKLSDVDEAAETTIAQNVSMVNGVAQVQVYGAQKYAMRAQLDPSALASRQIGIDEVSAALQSGNTNLPTGTLYGQNHTFTDSVQRAAHERRQFGPMVVAYRNGSPVRLNELGRVIDSVQNDKTASWFNGVRRHRAGDSKAAGHQYRCGRGQHQEAACPGCKTIFLPRSESTRCMTVRSRFARR